jgi:hypothetical protein
MDGQTIRVHGLEGGSDDGTRETRDVVVEVGATFVMLHLPSTDAAVGECPAVWVEWKPNSGWYIVAQRQANDDPLELHFPDDSRSLMRPRDWTPAHGRDGGERSGSPVILRPHQHRQ